MLRRSCRLCVRHMPGCVVLTYAWRRPGVRRPQADGAAADRGGQRPPVGTCPSLTDRFQATTGIVASITFGASGQLAEQIKQGAPFDVFLSANESFVRDLAAAGLIKPDSVHRYARGSLVLAVYHEVGDEARSTRWTT